MAEHIDVTREGGALKSRAVINGNLVFLSGVHADDTSGDIKAQMRECLAKVDVLLDKVGSDQESIFITHIWLKDMRYFGAMNFVWNEWANPENPPSRTCVSGELFRPDVLVELVVMAYRKVTVD